MSHSKAILDRFLAFVLPEPTSGCYLWTGGTDSNGYGTFTVEDSKERRQRVQAHVFSWESECGPVPDGLELDHLCRTRRCVRRSHLDPVTHTVNVLRGKGLAAHWARRTACPAGHPLAEPYAYIGRNGRVCRICRNTRDRERRASR